jgi:vancomycin permeability regulator SanA
MLDFIKRFKWFIIIPGVLGFVLFLGVNIHIHTNAQGLIEGDVVDVKPAQAAIVLGARALTEDVPSHIYEDRLLKGLELYQNGVVEKILVSGDNGQHSYDELNVARKYLLDREVPAEDIFLDHAGFNTFDTMYRARNIFGVDDAVIVTQKFHLPRAIFLAEAQGLDVQGYMADRMIYRDALRNQIRESLARIKAFGMVVLPYRSTYLGEPIDINGDGRQTWDEFTE